MKLYKSFLIVMSLLFITFNNFAKDFDIQSISVFITPGKPMQLFNREKNAEEIIIKKVNDLYYIDLCINVPRDGNDQYTIRTAEITLKEWLAVITVIKNKNLLNFKPDFIQEKIFDYGNRGFSITIEKSMKKAGVKIFQTFMNAMIYSKY